MLTDIFGDFEFDELGLNELQQSFTQSYVADSHHKAWFFDTYKENTEREASYYRAFYFYYNRIYELAIKELIELLDSFEHNRPHRVIIIDSILRCAVKVSGFPKSDMLQYMSQYEEMVTDYCDHLQFLSVSKTVLAKIDNDWASREFLNTVCLLCATVDLPEHWTAFGEKISLKVGPNFIVGYLTRAIILSEKHLKSAQGFNAKALQHKLHKLNAQLNELNLSPSEYDKAKEQMGWDITFDEKTRSAEEILPAHQCRSTGTIYKDCLQRDTIISDFRKQFSWMFSPGT